MKQRTFATSAWDRKGKVTRRERFLAEMQAVIADRKFKAPRSAVLIRGTTRV